MTLEVRPLERKREAKLGLNLTHAQLEAWRMAAAISGQLISDFVRRSCDDAAQKVIDDAERRAARAAAVARKAGGAADAGQRIIDDAEHRAAGVALKAGGVADAGQKIRADAERRAAGVAALGRKAGGAA